MKFRFSLRTFLVAVTVFSVPFAWIIANVVESRQELNLVTQLELSRGRFELMDSSSYSICGVGLVGVANREPVSWLARVGSVCSPATFERVTDVWLHSEEYDDHSLEVVGRFPYLKTLMLFDTRVTRKGIDEFRDLHPAVSIRLSTEGFEEMTFDEIEREYLVGDVGSSP